MGDNLKHLLFTIDLEECDVHKEFGSNKYPDFDISYKGTPILLKLLKKHNIKATFFTTASFAEKYPELIKQISKQHEIACHGLDHSNKKITSEDLTKAKNIIEKIINKPIYGFRAPRLKLKNYKLLKQAGFSYDSSLHPTCIPGRYCNFFKKRKIHTKNNIKIIPISVTPIARIPISWIWFRNYPLSFSKFLTNLSLINKNFLNTYFHPFEFIDMKKQNLPFYVTKNTGKKLFLMLDNYLSWLNKKNIKPITMHDFLKQSNVKTYFDKQARTYNQKTSTGLLSIIKKKEFDSIKNLLDKGSVLDAGLGSGYYAIKLKKLGFDVFGIDFSEKMVKQAIKNNIKAKTADIKDFNLNKKFNNILCAGVLEFCNPKNYPKILNNFKKHLKDNGNLVILTSRPSISGILYKLFHKSHKVNITLLKKNKIISILQKSGFKLINIKKSSLWSYTVKALPINSKK